jgi:hypothetical protein
MARRNSKRDGGAPKKKGRATTGKSRAKRASSRAQRASAEAHAENAPAPAPQRSTDRAGGDGGSASAAPASGGVEDRMQRAEQMVDRIGEGVGYCTSWFGQQLLGLAARARGQVADLVAEAQSIRQRNNP